MATIIPFPIKTRKLVMCTCGHEKDTHEHYRKGSDCGACGAKVCPKFKRQK